MQDFAAVTCNDFGAGKAFYVGAIVNEPAFYDAVIGKVLAAAGVEAIVTPPEGVEASVRAGEGKTLVFIVNHTEQEKTVTVPAGKMELLSGNITGDSLILERFGVAVIKI